MSILRHVRLMHRLLTATRSTVGCVYLQDEIARIVGARLWPCPRTWRWKLAELEPALNVLCPVNEIHERTWDRRSETAHSPPDSLLLKSPLHEFLAQPLGCHHLALYPYPPQADGLQVVVLLARGRRARSYTTRDLRTMEKLCARHRDEFLGIPLRTSRPRHAMPAEHTTELDADLSPRVQSSYTRALLAFFYGSAETRKTGADATRLPAALRADILRYRADYLRAVQTVDGGFYHAFTRRHRGRTLCLAVQSETAGTFRLTLHEDMSCHQRLHGVMKACRTLQRDRAVVFSACLALADGVRDKRELARRAGIAALQASSALRIINRARRILTQRG